MDFLSFFHVSRKIMGGFFAIWASSFHDWIFDGWLFRELIFSWMDFWCGFFMVGLLLHGFLLQKCVNPFYLPKRTLFKKMAAAQH